MSTISKDDLDMNISDIFLSLTIASGFDLSLDSVKFIKYFLKEFRLTITQLIKILEEET